MTHPHHDLILEYLRLYPDVEWRTEGKDYWSQETPTWYTTLKYEVRSTKRLYRQRVKIPKAETKKPDPGTIYFTPDPSCPSDPYRSHMWRWETLGVDLNRLRAGVVYLKKDDAIARAKAMLEVSDER